MLRKSLLILVLVFVCGGNVSASESMVSEVRVGAYVHDIDFWSFHRESGTDINGEILFVSPDSFKSIMAPRPHLGGTVNLSGNTSHIYGGLTWQFDLTSEWFLDANLGASIHNGRLDTDDEDRKSLGSRILFRLGGGVGYNLTKKWNVSLQYEHMSNGYLTDPNEGMDNIGMRLGYRF